MIAETLYPDAIEDDYWFGAYGYQPIIDYLAGGSEFVLLQVDEADYQGDSYVVMGTSIDRPVEFLNFGWGSCSGCDALQACDSFEELDVLIGELQRDIVSYNSGYDLLQALTATDHRYHWYVDAFKNEFIPKLKEMVGVEDVC